MTAGLIIVFLLIQSKSKGWASSAALHQGNTNSRIDTVLLHV